ncbi:putative membrane protein [Prosthecobacter fusiformis]|uniref:Putative membrane protein n=1 Tax=Prosthecobacter fusiformis TaxID=48464 RepID=A0A4R7RLG1_9BACT|nr:hypothetical protein [Prosthecobacter fusiformis]TDU66112.1 putative membrane protein [Prosthecobacter fusiformis]
MFGLTNLGVIHTAIGVVALIAGFIALIRDRGITWNNGVGKLYVITTVLTCLTGFGIFQHGGFGAPHVLGIITLLVLWLAWAAENRSLFGVRSRVVATVSYSATFFFHWIPTITETSTRFPLGSPLITDRNGPELQAATGVLFVLFIIGVTLQIRRLKARE